VLKFLIQTQGQDFGQSKIMSHMNDSRSNKQKDLVEKA